MRNPLSTSELTVLKAEGTRSQQAGHKLYASLGKPTPEHISDPEWVREYDAALRLFGRGETLLNYFQQFKKYRLDELQNPFTSSEIARLRKYKGIGERGLRKSREYEDLAQSNSSTWWQWHVTRIQTEASTTAIQWMIDTFTVAAKPPLPGSKFYGEQMAPLERERDDPNYWSQYNNPIHSLPHVMPPTSPHSFTESHAFDELMLPRNPVVARPGEPFVWNYSSPPPNADVQHRAMALPPKPRKGRPGFFRRVWNWLQTE